MLTRVSMVDRFFYVSLDRAASDAACAAGYPVVHVPALGNGTKSRVYQAKYGVAVSLIKQGAAFVFLEMDVWLKTNLLPVLVSDHDLVIGFHQDNPFMMNIGLYYIAANERTEALFKTMLSYLVRNPGSFDQVGRGGRELCAAAGRLQTPATFASTHSGTPDAHSPRLHRL